MEEKRITGERRLSKGLLTLIAILLAFLLLLVFIWLWYDIRISSLDKDGKSVPASQSINR
jgi:HAMP domain-containing protein